MRPITKTLTEKEQIHSNLSKLIDDFAQKTFTLNRQYLLEELPIVMAGFEQGLLFESVLPQRSLPTKSSSEKPSVFLIYPKKIEPIFKEAHQYLKRKLSNSIFTTKFIEVDIEAWEENGVEQCRAHIPDEKQLRCLMESGDKYCVFLTSLGKNYHEGAHLDATLNLFEKIINTQKAIVADTQDDEDIQKHKHDKWHIRVVLGDTLQAYNFSSDILTEDECDEYRKLEDQAAQNAYLKSMLPELKKRWSEKGNKWLIDAIPKYQRLSVENVDVRPTAKLANETNQDWLARSSTKNHRWVSILTQANNLYRFTPLREHLYKGYWRQRKNFIKLTKDNHTMLNKAVSQCISKDKKKQNSPSQQFDKLVRTAIAKQLSENNATSDDNDNLDLKTDLNIFYHFEMMVLNYSQRQHDNTPRLLPSTPTSEKTEATLYAYSSRDAVSSTTEFERKLLRRYIKGQNSPNPKDSIEKMVMSTRPHECAIANEPQFLSDTYIKRPRIDSRIKNHHELDDNDNANKISVLFGPSEHGKKKSILAYTQGCHDDYRLVAWFNCKKIFTIKDIVSCISRGFELAIDEINLPKAISKEQHLKLLIEYIENANKPSCLIFYDVESFQKLKPYIPKKNCHIFITKNDNIPNDKRQDLFGTSTNYIEVLKPTPDQMHELCRKIIGTTVNQSQIESLCIAFQQNPKMIELVSLFLRDNISENDNDAEEVIEGYLQKLLIQHFYPTQSGQSSADLFSKIYHYLLGHQYKNKNQIEKAEYILSVASLLYTDNLPTAFIEASFNKRYPKEAQYRPNLFSANMKSLNDCYLLLSNANGIGVMLDCFTGVVCRKLQADNTHESILLSTTRDLINYILDKDPKLLNDAMRDEMYPHLRVLLTYFSDNDKHIVLGDLYYLLALYESQSDISLSHMWIEKAFAIYSQYNRGLQTPRMNILVNLMELRKFQYYCTHGLVNKMQETTLSLSSFIDHTTRNLATFQYFIEKENPESIFASRIMKEKLNQPTKIISILRNFISKNDRARGNNSFVLIEKTLFTGEDITTEVQFISAIINGTMAAGPDLPRAKEHQAVAKSALSKMQNVTILDTVCMAQLDALIAAYSRETEKAKNLCETILLPFAVNFEGTYPFTAQSAYETSALVTMYSGDTIAIKYSAEALRLMKKVMNGINNLKVKSQVALHESIEAAILKRGHVAKQKLKKLEQTLRLNLKEIYKKGNIPMDEMTPTRENLPLRSGLGLMTPIEHYFSDVRRDEYLKLDGKLNSSNNTLSINMRDNETGDRLLHCATKNAAVKCIKTLLQHNCDTLALNNQGETAFSLIPQHRTDIKKIFIQYWLQKAKQYFQDPQKHSTGQTLIINALQACRNIDTELALIEEVEDIFLDYSLVLFEKEHKSSTNSNPPKNTTQATQHQGIFDQQSRRHPLRQHDRFPHTNDNFTERTTKPTL